MYSVVDKGGSEVSTVHGSDQDSSSREEVFAFAAFQFGKLRGVNEDCQSEKMMMPCLQREGF